MRNDLPGLAAKIGEALSNRSEYVVTQPAELRVLRDIDRQLARLEKASRDAPRPYQIVVLSDHGQSQGATFRQLSGHSLEDASGLMPASNDREVIRATTTSW